MPEITDLLSAYAPQLIIVAFLFVYLINMARGHSANALILERVEKSAKDSLESLFAYVGNAYTDSDDAEAPKDKKFWLKQKQNLEYWTYASGHDDMQQLFMCLKLFARHDLVLGYALGYLNGDLNDVITFEVTLKEGRVDPFILALVPGWKSTNMRAERYDIKTFTQAFNDWSVNGQKMSVLGDQAGLDGFYKVLMDDKKLCDILFGAGEAKLVELVVSDQPEVDPVGQPQVSYPTKLRVSFKLIDTSSNAEHQIRHCLDALTRLVSKLHTPLPGQLKTKSIQQRQKIAEQVQKAQEKRRQERILEDLRQQKVKEQQEKMSKMTPQQLKKHEEKEAKKLKKKAINKVKIKG